jgi:uncharacterized protein (DUF2267 family)
MTVATHVRTLEHGIHATNTWLGDMAHQLQTDDRQDAYRALRAVLHTLRDRLPIDESAQLAAQLPDLLRGVYYEGWKPSATPASYHHREQFYDHVAAEGRFAGHTEASFAVDAAMAVLQRHVSAGELEDVAAALPREIAELIRS